jgi:hypothetical protein
MIEPTGGKVKIGNLNSRFDEDRYVSLSAHLSKRTGNLSLNRQMTQCPLSRIVIPRDLIIA